MPADARGLNNFNSVWVYGCLWYYQISYYITMVFNSFLNHYKPTNIWGAPPFYINGGLSSKPRLAPEGNDVTGIGNLLIVLGEVPSGYSTVCRWKDPPCPIGKPSISMVIFHGYMLC